MNEIIESMIERRSVRKFKSDKVPRDLIEQIVEAGLYAPSGMGGQPTIILVITNQEMKRRLAEANRKIGGWGEDYDPFYGGRVVLVVLADKSHPTWQYDGPLVMENMMLAANALGLGSIWIHRAKEEFEQDEWKALLADLGAEGDYEGIGHCVIGYDAYPDGEYPEAAPRKAGRVFWVE
ncbi:MAG: nitroreductase [Clostridiales bacterium]|nr:nitroreductase [Clostridiales bacterium]